MSLTELTNNPRHDRLLMLTAEHGYMNTDELANLLDVSTQTVRRDIRKLSEQGLIMRHHGDTDRASSVVSMAFGRREVSQTKGKKAIAEAVANYIPDGSTILITTGTAVEHVAWASPNHNHLRVIANSLHVVYILYHNPHSRVMMSDGTLRSHNSGIIGPSATSFMVDFRVDYLVTSVGMVESDGVSTESDVNEANMMKTMMARAKNILLVTDHVKHRASAAAEIDNVAQTTAFFTDELPPAAPKSRLQDSQVEIIFPQEDAQTFVTVNLASYLAI